MASAFVSTEAERFGALEREGDEARAMLILVREARRTLAPGAAFMAGRVGWALIPPTARTHGHGTQRRDVPSYFLVFRLL